MIGNRFFGDVAVRITPDGATMRFIAGQPVMDQGFHNAAQISLFTEENYWGNILDVDTSENIGSDFQEVQKQAIVDIQTIRDWVESATRAFAWMRDNQIADNIEVTVINPRTDYVSMRVVIRPQGQDAEELVFVRNGLNWIMQAQDPASERLENGI